MEETIKSATTCPTCGSEVDVEGTTTHYYIPKKLYSEEDMIDFTSFVNKNYIKGKGFYYMKGDFEKKHKVSINQVLEQFKKKSYAPSKRN
jgi:hypothetical protein